MEPFYHKFKGELAVKASLAKVEAYLADRRAQLRIGENSVAHTKCTLESKELYLDAIQLDELEPANKKLDDSMAEVQDPLREVNLGDEGENKPTYISQLLDLKFQTELEALLRRYRDCFAWDYDEMPGLSRELVEHRLPIREGCRPFTQPLRRMSPEVTLKVKDEIERLLKAGSLEQLGMWNGFQMLCQW